jgi:hypothetical protein
LEPPAPGWFCTMMPGFPGMNRAMWSAIRRAYVSYVLPALVPTNIVICAPANGDDCATACFPAVNRASSAARHKEGVQASWMISFSYRV